MHRCSLYVYVGYYYYPEKSGEHTPLSCCTLEQGRGRGWYGHTSCYGTFLYLNDLQREYVHFIIRKKLIYK